jgi:catechol 2,3-dioxygenase-like lactoylglutathione lyase family enzyme
MFDHVDFAVTDLARSRAFYVAALAPLGLAPCLEVRRDDGREGTAFGSHAAPRLWIGRGEPVRGRLHIAFTAPSRDAVDAFHAGGLAAGGSDHGAPALRERYGSGYYSAYVRDPDGHVIEAVYRLDPLPGRPHEQP